MTNTQGLDALAALCGSTAAAASEDGGGSSPAAPPSSPSAPPSALAAASLYARQVHQQQQQQQQTAHAHALQLQRALAARPTLTNLDVHAGVPPAAVAQARLVLQAAAAQQQQQAQQHAQARAIAAQILAAQQQQGAGPGLAALTPALAGLAGGPVVPGAIPSPGLPVSSPAQPAAVPAQASPSTLAMPPPPTVAVPTLPLSSPAKGPKATKGKAKAKKSKPARSRPLAATTATAAQPPIQDILTEWEDKKQAKRAANRLSAHLSRKRKKLFIEDLKDENEELRRKEQILRSIPDLIVVFDSSGRLSFVSHSVTRFLEHSAEELEDTSFWDRITEESVRSIKSAFMDALAVKRSPEEDSAPLMNGNSMEIALLGKDDEGDGEEAGTRVSLKGVVHFAGESPECVCSIRPLYDRPAQRTKGAAAAQPNAAVRAAGAPTHQVSDIDSEKSGSTR